MSSDIDRALDRLTGYVSDKYYSARRGLQKEISETIGGLVEQAMKPILMQFIGQYGQQGFNRLVREDRDLLKMIEKYRPSYLFYVDKARRLNGYITWDSEKFAKTIQDYLEEKGIRVYSDGHRYLVRTCERFRKRIYD